MHPSRHVIPLIDLERCDGSGHCVARCPTRAVELRAGKAAIVRPDDCTFCPICESYCPNEAIGRPFRIIFALDSDLSDGCA